MKRALGLLLLGAAFIATPAWAVYTEPPSMHEHEKGDVTASAAQGIVMGDRLEGVANTLWKGMDRDEIKSTIDAFPDDTGSRTLNQLVKAVLVAPLPLFDGTDKKDDGESTKAAGNDPATQNLTALRLKKLLAMGGLDEAKALVDLLDTDDMEPALMEQVMLTLVASDNKEAACIDLLAYRDEAADQFAKLSDDSKTILNECLKESAPKKDTAKKDYSLAELKELGPWESALALMGKVFSIKAEGNVIADFNALSPFQKSLIMHSAGISPRLQWRLIGPALSRDYVSIAQAQDIYSRADVPASLAAVDVRRLVSSKPGFERLPTYYKALANDKGAHADMPKELATPIAAAGVTYDLYALLPFQPYLTQLDMSTLSVRSAFINTLAIYLNGGNLIDLGQNPKPDEAAWIFTALNGEQPASAADADMWAQKNLALLGEIAPELENKLTQRLQDMVADDENKSSWLKDYVNKKSLTDGHNYVMHDDKALLQAESFGEKGAVGPMLVQLALADKKTNPDHIDPEGMMRMNRLLEKTGLTQTAHKLLAEGLVFHMVSKTSSLGNNKLTQEK